MAWTTALLLVLGIAAYGVAGDSFLTKLAKYVKKHSDPDVAPQHDASHPVYVDFTYAMMNIADVDKEHNTFTTETYVSAQWQTDISWDPADYGGADMITLPVKYFWTPHMQPINTAVEIKDLSPGLIVLLANGTANYNQFAKTTGLCDVSHIETGSACNAKSSLWGYSKDQVAVRNIRGDTTGAIPFFAGCKYQIIGFDMKFVDFPFDGKTYQIIDSTFTIQEKPHNRRGPMRMFFEWH